MVDESGLVAHTVAVNHHAGVQAKAIVVIVVVVLFNHPISVQKEILVSTVWRLMKRQYRICCYY